MRRSTTKRYCERCSLHSTTTIGKTNWRTSTERMSMCRRRCSWTAKPTTTSAFVSAACRLIWACPRGGNDRSTLPSTDSGLSYVGDEPAIYKGLYEIKTKDDSAQWAALIQLCRTLNQTSLDQLEMIC